MPEELATQTFHRGSGPRDLRLLDGLRTPAHEAVETGPQLPFEGEIRGALCPVHPEPALADLEDVLPDRARTGDAEMRAQLGIQRDVADLAEGVVQATVAPGEELRRVDPRGARREGDLEGVDEAKAELIPELLGSGQVIGLAGMVHPASHRQPVDHVLRQTESGELAAKRLRALRGQVLQPQGLHAEAFPHRLQLEQGMRGRIGEALELGPRRLPEPLLYLGVDGILTDRLGGGPPAPGFRKEVRQGVAGEAQLADRLPHLRQGQPGVGVHRLVHEEAAQGRREGELPGRLRRVFAMGRQERGEPRLGLPLHRRQLGGAGQLVLEEGGELRSPALQG
jgi:hypothetical protein